MNIDNNEELQKLVKQLLKLRYENNEKAKKLRKTLWDTFIDDFHPERFPKPIVVMSDYIPSTRRKIDPTFMVTAGNRYVYYQDPVTNKKYATYKDLIDDCGRNIVLFDRLEKTENYFHYDKNFDVLVCYAFQPTNTNKHYEVNEISIAFRRGTANIPLADITVEADFVPSYSSFPYLDGRYYAQSDIFKGKYGGIEGLATALRKMYGTTIMPLRANEYVSIIDRYRDWCSCDVSLVKKTSKKQTMVDELVNFKLPKLNIKMLEKKYKNEFANRRNGFISVTSICHVKENVSVLRWTNIDRKSGDQSDGLRIYYVDGSFVSCKRNENGEFINYPITNLSPKNFNSDIMLDIKKEDVEGTVFQYYWNVLNDMEPDQRSLALLTFIKEPKLEQLAKVGLASFIGYLMTRTKCDKSFVENIYYYLGITNNDKDIFKLIGMNANQIKSFAKTFDEVRNEHVEEDILMHLKHDIFKKDDISDIDIKTFEVVIASAVHIGSYDFGRLRSIVDTLYENKDTYKFFLNNVLSKLVGESRYYWSCMSRYDDYITMVKELGLIGRFKINFKDEDQLSRMHDEVVELYNIKKSEIEMAKFLKNVKKMDKYQYAPKGSEFQVVLPKAPEDLANEGLVLSHCVRSYIPKVANGETNIVFIRKAEDVDTPFFTVEISNEGRIEQVHGSCNRNASSEPNLTDFVKKWAKSKKLIASDFNKIR